jgi:hypothetical protein
MLLSKNSQDALFYKDDWAWRLVQVKVWLAGEAKNANDFIIYHAAIGSVSYEAKRSASGDR